MISIFLRKRRPILQRDVSVSCPPYNEREGLLARLHSGNGETEPVVGQGICPRANCMPAAELRILSRPRFQPTVRFFLTLEFILHRVLKARKIK